ncbi:hypothetical protein AVEN_39242-1 [Araneus ventricosus]|uniref:Uncharacterized protein n=1 Tax=Araneus ventricosus TaxID=182803 RepID=A0A4Y2ETU4_ARAVE|nr:hypothetical protein AVEN_39242-1 [Araneus ventricosus]
MSKCENVSTEKKPFIFTEGALQPQMQLGGSCLSDSYLAQLMRRKPHQQSGKSKRKLSVKLTSCENGTPRFGHEGIQGTDQKLMKSNRDFGSPCFTE